jgi:phage terminase small subunit
MKIIAGTFRPDRAEPEDALKLPKLEDVPPAPDWLPNAYAVNEWNRLAPMLHRFGLLTVGSVQLLGHLCALHGAIVQKWAAGTEPTGQAITQYRALCGEFGLTPHSAMKMGARSGEDKSNKFARHRKRSKLHRDSGRSHRDLDG